MKASQPARASSASYRAEMRYNIHCHKIVSDVPLRLKLGHAYRRLTKSPRISDSLHDSLQAQIEDHKWYI